MYHNSKEILEDIEWKGEGYNLCIKYEYEDLNNIMRMKKLQLKTQLQWCGMLFLFVWNDNIYTFIPLFIMERGERVMKN